MGRTDRQTDAQSKLTRPSRPGKSKPVSPVYAGDVDDNVDHIAAQLVGLHVHRRAVGGDVDLTDNIEEEGLLDP